MVHFILFFYAFELYLQHTLFLYSLQLFFMFRLADPRAKEVFDIMSERSGVFISAEQQ